ncbi:hypothetical protein HWV23_03395 [Natronomonas halophila]|uniref:hypothetical protein n=1 Tax=Natronomonas halophila TaxID=2747817 RepID=UPI0015B3F492|nr:hypothetical protein [Natronomonas halophila]QLD84796.1 hypothetical protein HWV23_03395 [Natronomonas halophila]
MESIRDRVYSHPVITILALGVIFRIVFFNLVVVNYDAGLYLYDTKLLLEGQVPLIDYFSRSPLFHAFLSPAILLDLSPIVIARVQMALVSLTLGVAIYLVTTQLHSREAGIMAMAVFVLAPFELVYGLWLKTEQVAQLVVLTGLLPLLGHLDDDYLPLRDPILLGGAVGTAFFVRRVVVVHFGVILVFLLYYRYGIKGKSFIDSVSRGALFVLSTGLTVMVGYMIWSGGSTEHFIQLLNTHLFGLISEPVSPGNGAEGQTGILENLFSFVYVVVARNIGYRITYMRAAIVLLPVLLLLLIYPVTYLRRRLGNTRTLAMFVVLGLGAVLSTFSVHFAPFTESSWLMESTVVSVIVGFGLPVVLLTPQIDGDSDTPLWNPKLLLPAGLVLAIVASYAIRDRGIFVTYFQDAFPYLSIITGITALVILREIKFETVQKIAWSCLLVSAIIISLTMANPLVVGPAGGDNQITVTDTVAIGNDLHKEFGDDAQGFSAQPLYILEAGHRVTNDFSRKYWTVTWDPESSRSKDIIRDTNNDLKSGNTQYVIVERRTETIFSVSPAIEQSVNTNYCASENITQHGGRSMTIYTHKNHTQSCG